MTTDLNPFETEEESVEGQIALEVLPQVQRPTWTHEPIIPARQRWLWVGGVLLGGTALGVTAAVVLRYLSAG
ncbi:MAG: hypothetical protein AAFU77_16175 [Myxococcota bacterium]